MIYVAAKPPERMPALAPGREGGLTILVVPSEGLVDGRPPGIRMPMRATLEVSGCRGFLLGARRERERERRRPEASAA